MRMTCRTIMLAAAGAILVLAGVAPDSAWAGTGHEILTLRGQIVCSNCWNEEDRAEIPFGTEADRKCHRNCSSQGVPTAIAVSSGDEYELYVLKNGLFSHGDDGWNPWVGKFVEVTGATYGTDTEKTVNVDTLTVIESGNRPPAAASATTASTKPAANVAPYLSLHDLHGKKQKLSDLKGDVVVLNFWATWCFPCIKEMPELVKIQTTYGPKGVQVIGASIDTPDVTHRVKKMAKKVKVNFPIWLEATYDDLERFGEGSSLPLTIIIDREGRIVETITEATTEKELASLIDAILDDANAKSTTGKGL